MTTLILKSNPDTNIYIEIQIKETYAVEFSSENFQSNFELSLDVRVITEVYKHFKHTYRHF